MKSAGFARTESNRLTDNSQFGSPSSFLLPFQSTKLDCKKLQNYKKLSSKLDYLYRELSVNNQLRITKGGLIHLNFLYMFPFIFLSLFHTSPISEFKAELHHKDFFKRFDDRRFRKTHRIVHSDMIDATRSSRNKWLVAFVRRRQAS